MPKSRDIEVGKQQRHSLLGNGSISVYPPQQIKPEKINCSEVVNKTK
jgi:hypothetical protein